MKVLASSTGSALVFSQDGHAKFIALTDRTEHTEGVVTEIPDIDVARQIRDALAHAKKEIRDAEGEKVGEHATMIPYGTGGPFAYVEERDLLRDITFIRKNMHDVPEGTTVKVKVSGRGIALDIPKSALPNRQAGLKVGSRVAVGPNITPKALMNAHGTVVSGGAGARVKVEFDEGDLDRVNRATGKPFANPVSMHKATLEVIA